MKTILPHLLATVLLAILGTYSASAQVTISSVAFNSNPNNCSNTIVTVGGLHYCSNYVNLGQTYSVSGTTITVNLNYTVGFVCLPAIVTYSQSVNLGALAAGTYTVIINTYLNSQLSNTSTNNTLVVSSCCTATASFSMSADSICPGDSVSFASTSTGQNSQAWFLNSVQYSTDSVNTLGFSDTGAYSVSLVAVADSCNDTTTQVVYVSPLPSADLGNDTTVCEGDFALFSVLSGQGTYLWSSGSSGSVASLDSIGSISVTVTNSVGCTASDTASLTGFDALAMPDLGSDIEKCPGTLITLDAGTGWQSIQWSTGATAQTIDMAFTGVVWVEVTGANGCAGRDSIQVSDFSVLPLSIYTDSSLCGSTTLFTDNPFTAYSWSTLDLTASTFVDESGTYSVTVTDANGCSQEGSIAVTIYDVPAVDLGNDTFICGSPLILSSNVSGSALWSTGSTANTLPVTQSGLYWLQVTNTEGCAGIDSILVSECLGVASVHSQLSIYPNPTHGLVELRTVNDFQGGELQLYSPDGRLVMEKQLSGNEHLLDLHHLPAGNYILRLITPAGVNTKRLQLVR